MNKYIEIAQKVRDTKHPNCNFLFLAGSLLRGEGTNFSDLDIVVIYDKLEKAYRESFIIDDTMIETFVHDPETIDFFIEKSDKPDSNPSLSNMIIEGIVIPKANPLSQELKNKAKESISKGPDNCNNQEIMNMRYEITNLIDDIRDYRNDSELLGTLSTLYSSLAQFYFKANKYWAGKDKYISRAMMKIDPKIENDFSYAFYEAIINKKIEKVLNITEEILKPFGGFLFDGYRFDAKEEMRTIRE
jgi:predicted nucleotidyltransferase